MAHTVQLLWHHAYSPISAEFRKVDSQSELKLFLQCVASTWLNIDLDFCAFINCDEVEVNENAKKERATLIHQAWSSRAAPVIGH